jgi:hypothetical protein
MKREPGANKPELPREEWDFRDFQSVPQSEIETCFIYEYARELVRRSPRILDLRAELEASPTAKTAKELIKIMNKCFPDFPVDVFGHNWFPDVPWQRLDEKLRSKVVKKTTKGLQHYWKRLSFGKLHIQTLRNMEATFRNVEGVNTRSVETFRYFHEIFRTEGISETEYGFFAINWSYRDSEIRRAFEQWLSDERDGRKRRGLIHIAPKPRGRGGFRDQLNCLGALRVREHYPREQLADHPYRLKISARPYSNLPDLYEAAKKAGKLLGNLLQVADRS